MCVGECGCVCLCGVPFVYILVHKGTPARAPTLCEVVYACSH